ncbi:hypothetical protein ABZ532_14195 [Streptomyces sp. NPDC019396]|uniref:hypothetical protein n=1 Tax=Streptomyces sp. NPDC019396 TaxID=3154687 RepID=UPI00340E39FD
MKRTRTSRTIRTAALTAGARSLTLGVPSAPAQAADGTPRIDLRVLAMSDRGAATASPTAGLDGPGTPYTAAEPSDAQRPVTDAGFLATTATAPSPDVPGAAGLGNPAAPGRTRRS